MLLFSKKKEIKEKELKELELQKENLLSEISNLTKNKNNLEKEIEDTSSLIPKINNEIRELSNTKDTLTEKIKNREQFYVDTELKYIDFLDGLEFETYCAKLLIKNGFNNTKVTKCCDDNGGDVIAEKDNIKYVFQCKRFNEKVSAKPIGEALRGLHNYNCDKAVVITNNTFTSEAIKESKQCNVELWGRKEIENLLRKSFDFDCETIDLANENYKYFDKTKDLFIKAVEVVLENNQASASFLIRKFKIGYAEAGRLMDQMEAKGIISKYEGAKPRTVLITIDDWIKIKENL